MCSFSEEKKLPKLSEEKPSPVVNAVDDDDGVAIGHFRITFGLFFKASPGAHLFI